MISDDERQTLPVDQPRRKPLPPVSDEPEDYSDEIPLPDNVYADCAAADFEAQRCRA